LTIKGDRNGYRNIEAAEDAIKKALKIVQLEKDIALELKFMSF
jgi:hypothetical protein